MATALVAPSGNEEPKIAAPEETAVHLVVPAAPSLIIDKSRTSSVIPDIIYGKVKGYISTPDGDLNSAKEAFSAQTWNATLMRLVEDFANNSGAIATEKHFYPRRDAEGNLDGPCIVLALQKS